MHRSLLLPFLVGWTGATIHHLFVGTVTSRSIYVFEFDDMARTLVEVRNEAVQAVSPSISFDQSKRLLYSSSPTDGKLSRYSVGEDFSLRHDSTEDIPKSCNTTSFVNIKIASDHRRPNLLYVSASTGTCSTLFSVSVLGPQTLQSDEIAGDVRSFAWSPDGRHLYALDSQSSSLLHFNVADVDATLLELLETNTISDTAATRQVITHPMGHRLYVIAGNTNELIDIRLLANGRVDGALAANRSAILFTDTPDPEQYVTTSVAISSSNSTLWTLSRTGEMSSTFLVTVFRLDAVTGAVERRIARASFTNWIDDGTKATSVLVPAPFDGDMVAITTYPGGMVAVLGLVGESIRAYGRALSQDEGCCGEGVWLD